MVTPVMTREEKIEHVIGDTLREIEKIRVSYGSPDLLGGPTTDCGAPTQALYDPCFYDEQLDDVSIDLHDTCIERLYKALGMYHVGSGLWVCDFYTSTKWNDFAEEAGELIQDFIASKFLDTLAPFLTYASENKKI